MSKCVGPACPTFRERAQGTHAPASIWAAAPAASQDSSSFVNLSDHNPESDSQFHSLKKEILSAMETDPFTLTQVTKLSNLIIFVSRNRSVTKTRIPERGTMSSYLNRKQNYRGRKVTIRKKALSSYESKANGIGS